MGKYTKGNWYFYEDSEGFCINSDDGKPKGPHIGIASIECGENREDFPERQEALANVMLIAAAPKLLEALKKALVYVEGAAVWCECCAAITQAEWQKEENPLNKEETGN